MQLSERERCFNDEGLLQAKKDIKRLRWSRLQIEIELLVVLDPPLSVLCAHVSWMEGEGESNHHGGPPALTPSVRLWPGGRL